MTIFALQKKLYGTESEVNIKLQQRIELVLLNQSSIFDCAVLVRRLPDLQEVLFAFYVPQGPVNRDQLYALIAEVLHDSGQQFYCVPVFKIPRTSEGIVDYDFIESIPILADDFLLPFEQQIQIQLSAKRVAVIRIPNQVPQFPPYHLSLLLPKIQLKRSAPSSPLSAPSNRPAENKTLLPAIIESNTALSAHETQAFVTLLEMLQSATKTFADRIIRFVFADAEVLEFTYADLGHLSEKIYAGLIASGLTKGDKLVFQMQSNFNILATFWACQMGGFIPVIAEVPSLYQEGNQAFERVLAVLQLLDYPWIVTDEASAHNLATCGKNRFEKPLRFCSIETLKAYPAQSTYAVTEPDDITLFNLSSGSTGVPKCIMLTHRNLLTRAYGTNQLCEYASNDKILNWLPLDHIGSISDWHIRCVLLGCEMTYVDKAFILGQALNWLSLMDRYRITHSWAPNFAFALINKQLNLLQNPTWDLSCIKTLVTAGEAVSDESSQRFMRLLASSGLSATAIKPAFGMAELGSGITYFIPKDIDAIRFHSLTHTTFGQLIERAANDDPAATHFADLGAAIPGVSIRIVDNENKLLPIETIGRVQVKGDVVFKGYFNNPAANAAAFLADGWFMTGDLGFLSEGHLVLTGREKEVIIINGANYYCQEIEETLSHLTEIESSYTAACGVKYLNDNEEKLALFFVARLGSNEVDLIKTIRSLITNRLGIKPSYLVPLDKQQIPKTSIGKIQRTQLKQRLEAGEYDSIIQRLDLLLENTNTLPAWFYRKTWIAKQAQTVDDRLMAHAVLILMDSVGLGTQLALKLQSAKQSAVVINSSSQFKQVNDHSFDASFQNKADLLQVFQTLSEKRIAISQIISLIDYDLNAEHQTTQINTLRLASFIALIQAVNESSIQDNLKRLIWVANDSFCINDDDLSAPSKTMVTGFTKAFANENLVIDCIHIDFSKHDNINNSQLLYQELSVLNKEKSIAFRNGLRYVPRLELLKLFDTKFNPHEIKVGGLYLISGGLGGIGFELCRKLGRFYKAKLLIIGRSPLINEVDSNSAWLRYNALCDEGIACQYEQADICDQGLITALANEIESKYGQSIDGLFHLAGWSHECAVVNESVESVSVMSNAKIEGIAVLGDLLKTRKNTFLVAFSSVNTTFGGANSGTYAAANNYTESYCRQLFKAGYAAFCYAWCLWDGLGMNISPVPKSVFAAMGIRSLTLEDGLNSLFALLNFGIPEAVIGLDTSKNAVQMMLTDAHYAQDSVLAFVESGQKTASIVTPKSLALIDRFGNTQECRIESIASIPTLADGSIDKDLLKSSTLKKQEKKTLPKNSIEMQLLELWRAVLQIDDIGIEDNFFELGGDSILTLQLVTLISARFQQNIPASVVFHAPTISQLAEVVGVESTVPDFFSLVPIKTSGSKPPLFFVQSDHWDLIKYFDADQPCYVLNYGVGAKSTESRLTLPESVEAFAAHFVEEIQVIQAEGPYYLIGHSNAGMLAYEMAQQLKAKNQTIAFLGLIDTYYLPEYLNKSSWTLRHKLLKFMSVPLNEQIIALKRALEFHKEQIMRRFFTKKEDLDFVFRSMHLFINYQPKPYSGEIVYVRCISPANLRGPTDDVTHWLNLAQEGGDHYEIPCDHLNVLFEPHVKKLAEYLKKYLHKTAPLHE